MPRAEVDGVLISGVYGSGKSSVAAEIAETLERRGVSYAAIDLDWLTWFAVPGMKPATARRVYLSNVTSVVTNVVQAGVRHVILAAAVRDSDEVRALESAARLPLRVVRLEVPPETVVRRLRADPTTGRRDDLEVAVQWRADSVGAGIQGLSIANDGPIHDVACEIIDWLGWTVETEGVR